MGQWGPAAPLGPWGDTAFVRYNQPKQFTTWTGIFNLVSFEVGCTHGRQALSSEHATSVFVAGEDAHVIDVYRYNAGVQ